jgi:hypothetical protein
METKVSESCMERIFQFEDDQLMGTFESFSSAAPGASGPLTESLDFFFEKNFKNGALSLIRGKNIWMCSLNGYGQSATSLCLDLLHLQI